MSAPNPEKTKEKKSGKEDKSFKDDAIKRIFIVDDDRALAELLAGFFQKAGMESKFETKGKDAINTFKEFRPHLVLLDLLLPDLMGFEVLKRMKEPAWADQVAFIIMSGIMKDQGTISKAKNEMGADEFLEKPFNVREMHNVVLRYLGLESIEEKTKKKEEKKPTPMGPSGPAKAPRIPEPEVTIEGGDLGEIDLPRILSAFFTAKTTGVLKVNYKDMVKAIYFEEGKPIFAASNDPRDRLGEIGIRIKKLSLSQVSQGLEKCKEPARLGTTLVELGFLTSHDLYELIQLQVREIILSCFQWDEGRYAFNFEDMAGREMIKLQTPPADIVLDGIRKYYPIERLKQMIMDTKRILVKSENPAFRFQSLHMGSSEMRIFDLINGQRPIQEILGMSKAQEINVLQLIYGLLVMKIVEDKP